MEMNLMVCKYKISKQLSNQKMSLLISEYYANSVHLGFFLIHHQGNVHAMLYILNYIQILSTKTKI